MSTKLRAKIGSTKEVAFVLLGERKGPIWHARMVWKRQGDEASVHFDGARVLAREEQHGDVVGFFHTHPEGLTQPSVRDDRTMQAWSFSFGKPLLCVIGTSAGYRGWVYDYRWEQPKELDSVAAFRGNWMVAVMGAMNDDA